MANIFIPQQDTGSAHIVYESLGHSVLRPDSTWIMGIGLLCFMIIGLVRFRSVSFLGQLFSTMFSDIHWRTVTESVAMQNRQQVFWLNVCFVLATSLFLYEVMVIMHVDVDMPVTGILLFSAIVASVMLFMVLKLLLHFLIGYVFEIFNVSYSIFLCKVLSVSIFGVCILPLAVMFPYVNEGMYGIVLTVVAGAAVLMYLWRILRVMRIILRDYLSLFYSILYLCTVEAIPMICVYKILIVEIA
ncbi:MAG: DUF4271 domain-containing protein [Bacteroidales bacterium]|nr:DUF4271 domain-containing protein [Bacteroidales bacterium]